jgi:outer membrane protein OmpA-like peptidoglycan-associated protein
MIRAALITALAGLPLAAAAQSLVLPQGAALTGETYLPQGEYLFAVGPFASGQIETLPAESAVLQQAWRIGSSGQTTLQLMASLGDQLSAQGFEILYQCRDQVCGGYDFRFATQVMGEPGMHVDLGDFRYLAARRNAQASGESAEIVSLLVSRSLSAGFIQIVRTVQADETLVQNVTVTPTITDPALGEEDGAGLALGARLETFGRTVLADLVFTTGSSDLGPGTFASLAELADYLAAHPDRSVVLVGHTDAQGALESNIALSRRRAASVVARLIEMHGVPAEQLSADGVGFLAPIASNLTDEGRTKNRRVEVVLTTTR